MVGGLLRILGCVAVASIVVGGVLYARAIAAAWVRIGRRLHLLPPAAPAPMGMPLERIVQDLRRLQPEARRPPEGMAYAKHRGLLAAYDDLLLDACRAVGVSTSLGSLPEGLERESERLRIEFELEQAGVRILTAS